MHILQLGTRVLEVTNDGENAFQQE